jgi:hypothetical protein
MIVIGRLICETVVCSSNNNTASNHGRFTFRFVAQRGHSKLGEVAHDCIVKPK